jgi:hypothetical protein
MSLKIFLLLAVSFLLVGCSGEVTPHQDTETAFLTATVPPLVVTATPTATVTLMHRLEILETSTATPIPTLSPTKKPITATNKPTVQLTLLPTFTPTVLPAARLDFQCLEIAITLPMTGLYTGTVVLGGYTDTLSYRLDLSTWIMKPLIDGYTGKTVDEVVSPDRKWLAFQAYNTDESIKNELIITTVDGKEEPIHIFWEEGWGGIKGWLDDQNL